MHTKIAIQGFPGAFHDIAARCYHQDRKPSIVPARTFEDLVEMVEGQQRVEMGMIAIENTIAGSLLNNYQLLYRSDVTITGELFLRIRQNLMAIPGQRISDLKEVHSHPIAIEQCREFFKQYPDIKLVPSENTAVSASRIKEKGWKNVGAIASTLAAEKYDLEILSPGIETNKQNFTRFFAIEKAGAAPKTDQPANKYSICFSLEDEPGTLHALLHYIADFKGNMTKIQSVPLVGKAWNYVFFIDFILENPTDAELLLTILQRKANNLRILGKYREGTHFES